MENTIDVPKKKIKKISYAKWGYIFIVPFFIAYLIFTLYPQILTIGYSFFTYGREGRKIIGPDFVGLKNYIDLFTPNNGTILVFKYLYNTIILWIICAVPQFLVSLLLAVIFTSTRLKIKGQAFFKTLFYLPNVIMASAFAYLFYKMFDLKGPVNDLVNHLHMFGFFEKLGLMDVSGTGVAWLEKKETVRLLIGVINYLMWFGNTSLMLMAGMQGIDESVFESARLDGAGAARIFKDITMPLLKPIFIYVFITSMIGGLQMFDVPEILTHGVGRPNETSLTMVMKLNQIIRTNYGKSGALSVVLFAFTFVLSIIVFKSMTSKED